MSNKLIGGFNKIIRNIVAGASDTEFEKVSIFLILNLNQRLTKATFHLDNKEPKEKHVICTLYSQFTNVSIDLLECLNGEHKD